MTRWIAAALLLAASATRAQTTATCIRDTACGLTTDEVMSNDACPYFESGFLFYRHRLSIAAPTVVEATVTGDGFVPMVGILKRGAGIYSSFDLNTSGPIARTTLSISTPGDWFIGVFSRGGHGVYHLAVQCRPCNVPVAAPLPLKIEVVSGGAADVVLDVTGDEPLDVAWYDERDALSQIGGGRRLHVASVRETLRVYAVITNKCGVTTTSTVAITPVRERRRVAR